MDKAIEVKDLRITYSSVQASSLFKAITGKGAKIKKFEAVKGVSFTVNKGEIVGLVGKNGSGKSTLLRCVANIFKADSGTLDTHGNTVALMSIGVGFHVELSGRENIFLSGMLMGFSKKYIEERLDRIIEFSELGEFIEQPVGQYSSGMYSKLAFAITSILDADIILCDEILSVGDAKFRQKSYDTLVDLIGRDDKTGIIVSHYGSTIRNLCTRVIWLNDGVIMMDGDPDEVMDAYEEFMGVRKKED